MPAKLPSKHVLPEPTQALLDAGLQHAVLMRAMPVLRHDLASPLSVMRMGTMLLKRRLGRGDMAPEQAVERVEQIEEQLAEITRQIQRLRQWDLQVTQRQSVHALVAEAIELARPMLMVRGTEMQALADDAVAWSPDVQAANTLLYVVLAAIYHLAEQPGPAPAHIAVESVGSHGVRIRAQGVSTSQSLAPLQSTGHTGAATQPPPLDEAALQQLAKPLGIAVRVSGAQVDISLPGAGNTPT